MHTELFVDKFGIPGLCYKIFLRNRTRTGYIELPEDKDKVMFS